MRLTFRDLPTFCDDTSADYNPSRAEAVYSALDSVNAFADFAKMAPLLDEVDRATYERDLAHTEVATVMAERGILVDQAARRDILRYYEGANDKLRKLFAIFSEALTGKAYEIAKLPSPQSLSEILYDRLGLPPEFTLNHETKEFQPTTNREALETLERKNPALAPFLQTISELRETNKKIAAISSGVSSDGRMRCTYGTAVLETGRWNCRPYVMRNEGISFHTITNEVRRVFRTDPGMAFVYCDLQSAESYAVALIFNDPDYFLACKSGDIHTYVATMLWPDLPWPGGNKADRATIKKCRPIAEEKYYRHFSRRDICKRDGHLTNYNGTPETASKVLRLPLHLCEEFNHLYLNVAFPGIKAHHDRLWKQMFSRGRVEMISPFGRRRIFHGRRDKAMHREMIANGPQSTVGDAAARGIYEVYRNFDPGGPVRKGTDHIFCLAHMHDAGLFAVDADRIDKLAPKIVECMQVPIPGYDFSIPADYEVGFNWAKIDPDCRLFLDCNPGGMAKPGEQRPLNISTRRIYKDVTPL